MELLNEKEQEIFEAVSDYISENWRKMNEIKSFLVSKNIQINPRIWRLFKNNFNKSYENGTSDMMIANTYRGYKLTTDKREISQSALDNFKKGITLIKTSKKQWDSLSNKNQLSLNLDELNDEERKMYDIFIGMN